VHGAVPELQRKAGLMKKVVTMLTFKIFFPSIIIFLTLAV